MQMADGVQQDDDMPHAWHRDDPSQIFLSKTVTKTWQSPNILGISYERVKLGQCLQPFGSEYPVFPSAI